MKLRNLEQKDAPLMLEWMHDDEVVRHLGTNFKEKTIDDCGRFIDGAQDKTENLHLAIVDENDDYMGTVSLKHIGQECAEFAITVRGNAMGKGYARYAMEEILNYGLRELKLNAIYWCVSPENKRAVRFYDKNGYTRTVEIPLRIAKMYTQELIWYVFS